MITTKHSFKRTFSTVASVGLLIIGFAFIVFINGSTPVSGATCTGCGTMPEGVTCNGGSCGATGTCSATCASGYRSGGSACGRCSCDCNVPCSNTACCIKNCPDECPSDGSKCNPPSCPSGYSDGVPAGWRSECIKSESCGGSRPDCSRCDNSRTCHRTEPTSQPALSEYMLYCFSGFPDSCVRLSTDPNNPTEVYPPRPGGGAFVAMKDVAAPSESRGMLYDLALETVGVGPIFRYDGWNSNRQVEVTASIFEGRTYHVSGMDASVMRCVDRNWCAGDSDPFNGEGPCSQVHGYFKVSHKPVVNDIQVLLNEKVKCMLPPTLGGTASRWTGRYGVSPEVNNPIDLEVVVSDLDGWADVDSIWLDIARPGMNSDYLCKNELTSYVSIQLDTTLLSQGFEKAVSTEVIDSQCQPNFCNSVQGACGGECMWDSESNLTSPESCNCRRNFVTNPFNPVNPRYQYDEPNCELRYEPGVQAQCHTCFAKPDHPDYRVVNVTRRVISATQAAYTFTIQFKDTYPEGIQQFYVMAQSGLLFTGNRDGGHQPRRTTNANWTWGFDFHDPTGTVALSHVPGAPANQMQVTNTISDATSGVRRLFDRKYWVVRDGATVLNGEVPPSLVWFMAEKDVTNVTSVDIAGLEGGDVVFSSDIREDIACNQIDSPQNISIQVGPRWITTMRKEVFGWGGINDPIPISGIGLSEFWMGTGNSRAETSAGVPSVNGWYSPNYTDENTNIRRSAAGKVPWYNELYDLAKTSEWVEALQGGSFYTIGFASELIDTIKNPARNGVFILDESVSTITIPSGTKCSGKKIIFVPGEAGKVVLRIEPDVTNENASSACLFIVRDGTIKVDPGVDKIVPTIACDQFNVPCNGADTISLGFITDGHFDVDVDKSFPRPDRLEIFGFVFSDSANFGRDMLWEDNWVLPTTKITYDPRYAVLLREMLGRRPYAELECGIVKGVESCGEWIETL